MGESFSGRYDSGGSGTGARDAASVARETISGRRQVVQACVRNIRPAWRMASARRQLDRPRRARRQALELGDTTLHHRWVTVLSAR